MGNGRVIILVFTGIFIILFFTDLAIFIFEHEKELYEEQKRYERKEMKRLLKEYYKEQGKLSRYDIRPKKKRKRGKKNEKL